MLIILFGLSGSGKNFVGDILQNHFHFHFWDADTVLPAEMRECIHNKKSFTQPMRDNFTQIIIENISQLQQQHQYLAVAQALYKERNRQKIQVIFPDAKFLYVKAEPEKIRHRLSKSHSAIDAEYAKRISSHFESPVLPHQEIENNSDKKAVINQLTNYLANYVSD